MKRVNEQISPFFLQQAEKLREFTKLLHTIVPPECINHVKVANIRNQTLMLITDSPVWSTRLRQLSPQILQFVQNNMPISSETSDSKSHIIHHLQINTRYQTADTGSTKSLKKSHQKKHISNKTAALLSQSADSLDNEQLKTALLKMASHTEDKKDK